MGERSVTFNVASVSTAFAKACTRYGVEGANFHDSGHTATTRFFEQGLNVIEVAAITGHEDLRSLKRYTQLDPASPRASWLAISYCFQKQTHFDERQGKPLIQTRPVLTGYRASSRPYQL